MNRVIKMIIDEGFGKDIKYKVVENLEELQEYWSKNIEASGIKVRYGGMIGLSNLGEELEEGVNEHIREYIKNENNIEVKGTHSDHKLINLLGGKLIEDPKARRKREDKLSDPEIKEGKKEIIENSLEERKVIGVLGCECPEIEGIIARRELSRYNDDCPKCNFRDRGKKVPTEREEKFWKKGIEEL